MKIYKLLLISVTVFACTKENVVAPQYIGLFGSWKMVTNNGVDLTFDIVSDTTKAGLSISNPVVTYNAVFSTGSGHNSTPSITLSGNIYDFNMATSITTSNSLTWNATYLKNLTLNSNKTQITGTSGFVSLAGYASSIKPPYIVNLSNSIIINRTK